MAINLLSKLRTELYKVSEFEEYNDGNDLPKDNTAILDFLNSAKSLRHKCDYEIIENFSKISCCDKDLVLKSLFYVRDIKFGLGERRVFRIIINYIANTNAELLSHNLKFINKYGRWDDYYALFNTPLEKEVIKIFKLQINYDLTSKTPSQLAKWLKSENTSSKISRKLGARTRILMGYTPREYRNVLSSLRKKLNGIERMISSSDYNSINYSKLSLSTCLKYKKCLIRNDKVRFLKYLKDHSLERYLNKKYSNSPFNIIDTIVSMNNTSSVDLHDIYNNIWDENCNEYKTLFQDTYVMISISGESRLSRMLSYNAAISSIIFFNMSNINSFKDYYMYFNPKPHFGKLENGGVIQKINSLKKLEVSHPCNIESGLDLLLFTSIKKELSNKEIPKNILIISDWDTESRYKNSNSIQLMKNKWGVSGYVMPKLKFWCIKENQTEQKICKDIFSNIFACGYSKEIFVSILKNELINYDDLLMKKITSQRYSGIL